MSKAKKKYLAKNLIRHNGERIEIGEPVELTATEAEQMAGAIVPAADETPAAGSTEAATTNWSELSYKELRQAAKQMGLDTAGKKAELIDRIETFQAQGE